MPNTNPSFVDIVNAGTPIGAQITYANPGAPTSTPGGTAQQQTPIQTTQQPTPSTNVVVTAMPASKPWYTTWWGLGLLGIGAFAGYKAFIK